MAGRIVLFGATGYTGRLTAEAMTKRGLRPVLAARSRGKLESLAAELGAELELATADVGDPPSVRQLVEQDDVLVTTVGPFARWGSAAAAASVTAGAHYLDSTGEPPFIREVFERYGPVAERADCAMLTAFGYDWVPGNLAGALALREAGEAAVRVDTGYFYRGSGSGGGMSGGTRASTAGALLEPVFAFRDGRVRTEPAARRYRTFDIGGKQRPAISVGASEHFALPRVAPGLREVNVYLGWFGALSRPMQGFSLATSAVLRVPGARDLARAASERFVKGSTGGPDAEERAGVTSHIVGIAYDSADQPLAEVHVTGVDGYTFTGNMLAWGAERAADGALKGNGALGPVEAFGLDELREGCAEAGLEAEVRSARRPAARGTGKVEARA